VIFRATASDVVGGLKTQTRRLVKPGDELVIDHNHTPTVYATRWTRRGPERYIKWKVGREYAVCPGRSKKAIAYIKIIGISRERLQDITEEDAKAEGCLLWKYERYASSRDFFVELWDSIHKAPGTRWADDPEVFRIRFKLIRRVAT